MRTFMAYMVLCLGAGAVQAEAQNCRPESIQESTPTSQFVLHDDGTVTDKHTGLTWMRCSLGQSWDGQGCSGQAATFTWEEAAHAVEELNTRGYAGFKDWRYPVVPELASIVERQCFNPRVNEKVFPNTPSVAFWSSMAKMGVDDQAYILDFGGGSASASPKSYKGPIRLVRGGPWWTPPAQMQ